MPNFKKLAEEGCFTRWADRLPVDLAGRLVELRHRASTPRVTTSTTS